MATRWRHVWSHHAVTLGRAAATFVPLGDQAAVRVVPARPSPSRQTSTSTPTPPSMPVSGRADPPCRCCCNWPSGQSVAVSTSRRRRRFAADVTTWNRPTINSSPANRERVTTATDVVHDARTAPPSTNRYQSQLVTRDVLTRPPTSSVCNIHRTGNRHVCFIPDFLSAISRDFRIQNFWYHFSVSYQRADERTELSLVQKTSKRWIFPCTAPAQNWYRNTL